MKGLPDHQHAVTAAALFLLFAYRCLLLMLVDSSSIIVLLVLRCVLNICVVLLVPAVLAQ